MAHGSNLGDDDTQKRVRRRYYTDPEFRARVDKAIAAEYPSGITRINQLGYHRLVVALRLDAKDQR